MKKERIFIAIVVLGITIILVALMFVQFKTIEETNVADIENMQESDLRAEISKWKNKYEEVKYKTDENIQKTTEYRSTVTNNQLASGLLDKELAQTNLLLGKTQVIGEGVVVKLQDTSEATIEAEDLVELINELRYAGAEAISINDQRVINTSDIVAIGQRYVLVNGIRVSSIYEVKAIGNQTHLSSTLGLKNDGYVDRYNNSGKSAKLTLQTNIDIPAYSKEYELKYIKGE